MAEFDLAVIGGGINGASIARDAAGRGLKVLLIEQNDLASGASSAPAVSTHGGLADIRMGNFGRARATLSERGVLLRTAPHLVRPIRVVMPAPMPTRSGWRARAELLVHDHLVRQSLLPARTVDLTHHVCGAPLRRRYTFGFEYSDAVLDVARLAVLNAVDAAARGAIIRTRTRLLRAERGETWTLMLNARGRRLVATARALVNAAGACAEMVEQMVLRAEPRQSRRLVKATHIVVRRLFDHPHGYALEGPGQHLVFALPFEDDFTLIGTANGPYVGDPAFPVAEMADIRALCEAINGCFRETLTPHDIVRSFVALACIDGKSAGIGDADLALEDGSGRAPLLSLFGGRAADHRRIGEAAVDRLMHYFAARSRWTGGVALSGGEFGALDELMADIGRRWHFLEPAFAARLARAYGRRVDLVLGDARSFDDLGACFGADLTAAEVRYLMRHEFAETADDVLWRRSRLGLRIAGDDRERLERFMASQCGTSTG